jgi:DNA ligase 1
MHNDNVATKNELGRTKRSTHQENLRGGGMLGVLVGEDVKDGRTVRAGTGFTMEQRQAYWASPEAVLGKVFKYKHFDHGVVNDPRHPVFLGWRDERDMS